MKPYIAKQAKLTKERIEAKLESGLARTLELYCSYLDSDRDYVISQALEIAFKKDKDFEGWLAAQESRGPADNSAKMSLPVPAAAKLRTSAARRGPESQGDSPSATAERPSPANRAQP